ncbi:MAG: TDP-N-acetylfucosamine:lipid II N-acetylfucosaminyltransferase [Synergistaceae bacterium]|nr:TDP-N-acetylfucosamine:lipid II N-acetylfucosaminyltransferase [Synergistaceae bacterium]
MMNIIVHIIARDKFTAGYIEFMKICFPEYEHHFFTAASGFPINMFNYDNIHYYNHQREMFFNPSYRKLLRECGKIIISGIWLSAKFKALMLASGLVRKTYLHFWGGDFYGWRNVRYSLIHPRRSIKKFLHHCLIRKCAGTINLIDTDIEKLCEIFPNTTKHFTAPMKGSPRKKIDYEAARQELHQGSTFRILAGNSAFPENQHHMTFLALEHLKDANIEILCPLSYGVPEYRDKVIAEGKRIFGDKFIPVTDYMDFSEYVRLLASCGAGVFSNDRQQGMGNISILLRLGKKVYLRDDTSMWQHFTQNMKYVIYPVSELEGITLEALVNFPAELAYNNIQIAEEYAAGDQAIRQWRKVFQD